MAVRRPLVIVGGVTSELPSGDLLAAAALLEAFRAPIYAGDIDSAPVGWVSIDGSTAHVPAAGVGALMETFINEDDSARGQLAFLIDNRIGLRFQLGGTWSAWVLFLSGSEVVDSIADADTTHAPSRNAVFDALALKAALVSPGFSGTPTAPTQTASDNSTKIATTAYADALIVDSIADTDAARAPSRNAVFDALAGKQAVDGTLTGLAAVTTAADTLIYATAADTFTTTPLTTTARSLLDDTTAADMRTTLGAMGLTPRVNTVTSSATPSINTDTTDLFTITALAAAITSMTTNLTGTPINGQRLTIRIKDNGTARAITWGTSFVSSGVASLLATTVISKTHLISLMYDSSAAAGAGAWVCVACDLVGY